MKEEKERTESQIKIEEFMESMRFHKIRDGVFWHMYFGRACEFDLSASGSDVYSIMSHIFRVATDYGREQKAMEMREALGITI
jgi:hypothetical protein